MRTKKISCFILAFVLAVALAIPTLANWDAEVEQYNYHIACDKIIEEVFEEIVFVDDLLSCPEIQEALTEYMAYAHCEEFLNNQKIALEAADFIWGSFPTNRVGEIMHPESFGGTYINDDGNLVLLVVSESFGAEDMLALGRVTNTAAKSAEYSYAELISVHQAIFYFLSENWQYVECPVVTNIGSISVNVFKNSVDVFLHNIDTENVQLFESTIIAHPSMVFIESHGDSVADCDDYMALGSVCVNSVQPFNFLTVRPGNAVLRSNGSTQSMGFRARDINGNTGFVTTMHGNPNHSIPQLRVNDSFYFGGVAANRRIGHVVMLNGRTDSAFVTVSPPKELPKNNLYK